MRGQNNLTIMVKQALQCREGSPDTGIIFYFSILQWDIVIYSHQHGSILERIGVQGEIGHLG